MAEVIAVCVAFAYALTNGFLDSGNAVATLVATRAARPGAALALGATATFVGALVVGTAVATTIAGIVDLAADEAVAAIGAGLTAAALWNLLAWARGLPSSGAHALVGGLTGAAFVEAGADAVRWGGLDGWRPVGVLGVLAALAFAPALGLLAGSAACWGSRRLLRRATRSLAVPVRAGHWAGATCLALAQGANDAQKTMGAATAVLVASGRIQTSEVPYWVVAASGAILALGTATAGWGVIRTVGHRIVRLRPVDGLAADASAAGVVLASTLAGAPISTTHVRASAVVGVALGRSRRRHVSPAVVRQVAIAWGATIPVSAALAAAFLPLWRWLS